jgi:hypothetical protein
MIITDKDRAIMEYEKAQGYENGIPEADEGIFGLLFEFDKKGSLTKEEIQEIASKYEKAEFYKTYSVEELTAEKIKEILDKAKKIDQENALKRNER